jgi:hypothetical protein
MKPLEFVIGSALLAATVYVLTWLFIAIMKAALL